MVGRESAGSLPLVFRREVPAGGETNGVLGFESPLPVPWPLSKGPAEKGSTARGGAWAWHGPLAVVLG